MDAQGRPTVLVIDDEPTDRAWLARTIQGQGWRFLEAPTLEKGVDVLRAHRVDLIVLDLNVPPYNGSEALEALQESLKGVGWPHRPTVVVWSGAGWPMELVLALVRLGVADMIDKSTNSSELVTRFSNKLAVRQALRQPRRTFERLLAARLETPTRTEPT